MRNDAATATYGECVSSAMVGVHGDDEGVRVIEREGYLSSESSKETDNLLLTATLTTMMVMIFLLLFFHLSIHHTPYPYP